MSGARGKALALYSGGLDSTLAARVVMEQGIAVLCLRFVSPFFGYHLLRQQEEYRRSSLEKFGIDVVVEDLSAGYLELLRAPRYGFGRNFNPCLDCKIFLLSRARQMMAGLGADFLVSGEVLGQRPMSQRMDSLRVIERDSGCDGLLLRPLCAHRLPPTNAEKAGQVQRDRLYNFSGRQRSPQIALAAELGINDYPAPAGGCLLTDPCLARRVRRYYEELALVPEKTIRTEDIVRLLSWRHFCLPGGGWLVMGRDAAENESLACNRRPDDITLFAADRAGPLACFRQWPLAAREKTNEDDLRLAAALVAGYAKRTDKGQGSEDETGNATDGKTCPVHIERDGDKTSLEVQPLSDATARERFRI